MPQSLFRFSRRPNRASEIHWRTWSAETFADAERLDRPVLLNLTAVWCHWCHLMDETTYSDPALISLINEQMVAVRVDADRLPHVQDRYTAGGWPTNAFLTPTGEVLWAGTYVSAEQFQAVAEGVLSAWRDRREHLQEEIVRRRRAMEAARSRQPSVGLVRREAADDVLSAIQESYDPRNGGFGGEPKFPYAEAIELLFAQSLRSRDSSWGEMADRSLEGMLAGELADPVEGGFFRYALSADWTSPRFEKLLEVNAALLRAYALGAQVRGRADWAAAAERTVAWVESTLKLPNGLWGASQAADDEYFGANESERSGREVPLVDDVVYSNRNAEWILALADAGGRLGHDAWIQRASDAYDALLSSVFKGGVVYHCVTPDSTRSVAGLLVDLVALSQAAIMLAQSTGRKKYLDTACELVRIMEATLWADEGAFRDHPRSGDDVGALRYPDRPFELNAAAARIVLDLSLITGQRSYHALAERTLAVLSPLAGRYGVSGAAFALAVEEFFDPPLCVAIVGGAEASAELRAAALLLPHPERRVWSIAQSGQIGGRRFTADTTPAAYVCGPRYCSAAVRDAAALPEAASILS
jgi:uncharacterized protein YyaL (SSP411 family)